MSDTKQSWNLRGLTSLLTLGGFLVMGVTGLVLYVVPQGRVAYWTDWRFLLLSKTQWGDIHILASLLFIAAGAFHVYFNWKQLMRYFYNRARGAMTLKRELAVAAVLTVLATVSGIYRLPPLSLLLDLNAAVKAAWVTSPDHEPPFGHAEELSLEVLCKKLGIPLDAARAALQARGHRIPSAGDSMQDLARVNGTTPMALYALIKPLEKPLVPAGGAGAGAPRSYTPEQVEETFADTGIGSRTLSQIAAQLGLELKLLRGRLRAAGLEVADDEPLRKAAQGRGLTPLELLKTMLVDGYRPSER